MLICICLAQMSAARFRAARHFVALADGGRQFAGHSRERSTASWLGAVGRRAAREPTPEPSDRISALNTHKKSISEISPAQQRASERI